MAGLEGVNVRNETMVAGLEGVNVCKESMVAGLLAIGEMVGPWVYKL